MLRREAAHRHVRHAIHETICLSLLCFTVCVQASSGGCEGGGCVEEVLRAEEAPRGAGLHAQEPVQKTGGVSVLSPRTSLWYDGLQS